MILVILHNVKDVNSDNINQKFTIRQIQNFNVVKHFRKGFIKIEIMNENSEIIENIYLNQEEFWLLSEKEFLKDSFKRILGKF